MTSLLAEDGTSVASFVLFIKPDAGFILKAEPAALACQASIVRIYVYKMV